jgi:hypothetical protein
MNDILYRWVNHFGKFRLSNHYDLGNMKFVFGVILFICFCSVNQAQTLDSSYDNSTETLDTTKLQETFCQSRYSFEPLIGIGLPPFKMLAGAGYYINDKYEVTIKYTGMFLPIAFDIDVISTGINMYEKTSSGMMCFLDLGGVITKKTGMNQRKINGVYIEGGLGYQIKTNVGFNTTLNFRIGEIIRNGENPLFVAGVDFIIGWLLKI